MQVSHYLFAALVAVLPAAMGCEDTGVKKGELGTDYIPAGCEYTVRLPAEIAEKGFDDGAGSGAPDHIHAAWAGPSESSFAINWHTAADTTATQILYGSDADAVTAANGEGSGVSLATGHHVLYGSILDAEEKTRVHEVHVCGLGPSTTYHYKVGGPGAWSDVYDFATAPAPGSKELFRFAVAGDSREEGYTTWALIQEAIAAQGVDFQLFTGDVVVLGPNQSEWNSFFESGTATFKFQDAAARSAFMVVNGNHDNLAINYVAQFAMPQELTDGELAVGKEWYSFNYANMHVVALNDTPEASALGQPQRDWLEADLAAVDREKTPWVVAMHHRPMYSCGGAHGSDLDVRSAWQPIFDAHKVDVVLAGHDHLYERTNPIRGLMGTQGIVADSATNGVPVDQSGTIYVVTGGAGSELYGTDDSCPETYVTESVRHYLIVEIEDRTMRYTAYRTDGSILDQFEYSR